MQRIKRISIYMCAFLIFLIIALPIYHITQWLLLGWHPFDKLITEDMFLYPFQFPSGVLVGVANIKMLSFSPFAKMIGVLTTLICDIPIIYSLWILRNLFEKYQTGLIFTTQNAKTYQKLGWCFFLNALISQPLYNAGRTLACTLSNSPGQRCIGISFGTPNLESIFCGIILIIVSWVMLEAYRLQAEQELTI